MNKSEERDLGNRLHQLHEVRAVLHTENAMMSAALAAAGMNNNEILDRQKEINTHLINVDVELAVTQALLTQLKRHRDDRQMLALRAEASFGARQKQARRKGAATMLANSSKQKDKATVRECWEAWEKHPENYKGKAAFARDMRDKFPNLESQPVIEGWCRIWERESKT